MEQNSEDTNYSEATALAKGWLRWLWGTLACFFMVLAVIGIIIPGLPAAVFIVLGAWAASRSSERMHQWIEDHHLFGQLLETWRSGYLNRRTKLLATLSMALPMAIAVHYIGNIYLLLFTVGGIGCGILWVWTRPEPQE
ncbi:YbaN family protein [Microbulbifer epialgicus]|uniref:YbaN family protein n=1 Tax=Microbulbifer epialgicus TaxID=393907 RepID=A0ABV4P065_9GAMM